ncbi:ankyrin repeat domain-containing protein [Nocardia cyriacigeorgica]|uniref:ankyrin repeat domain-containing protein n=1 Tax=Nocardia cyriacigeorgica TaxID=135487 RepID=UPI0018930E6D|nr:ankyrin repeat domain-containing protein [Nocardia cyriacigeorgica]
MAALEFDPEPPHNGHIRPLRDHRSHGTAPIRPPPLDNSQVADRITTRRAHRIQITPPRRTEIIGFILDQGIEAEPATLSKAANKGHAEAVRLLLGHGMKPDLPAEWPPLCAAAYGGSPECVQLLLRAGARIDVRMGPQAGSWGGKTPTELAAMHVTDGTAEILRLLAQ